MKDLNKNYHFDNELKNLKVRNENTEDWKEKQLKQGICNYLPMGLKLHNSEPLSEASSTWQNSLFSTFLYPIPPYSSVKNFRESIMPFSHTVNFVWGACTLLAPAPQHKVRLKTPPFMQHHGL